MKKKYTKPDLGTKKYAQFENVYTNCNQLATPCEQNPGQGGNNGSNIGNGFDRGFGSIS